MPNSRRRKFSVRNGIAGRQSSKIQNDLQTRSPGSDYETNKTTNNIVAMNNCTVSTNKMNPDSSRNSYNADSTPECQGTSLLSIDKKRSITTVDKDVSASLSNIELSNHNKFVEEIVEPCKDSSTVIEKMETPMKRLTRQMNRDRTSLKREKYPRQHRIRVRSPKRRIGIGIVDTLNKSNDVHKLTISVATEAIDWERELEVCDNVANVVESNQSNEDDERQSDNSSDDMCRICHGGDSLSQELGQLISACSCRGTVGRVHVKCLERWLTESGKSRCELCGTRYATRRVHRYGVPRALVMWILSRNAKQLMVDSLGIMLMSPLAVLAAWLSGRTLAGLMTQDPHNTPWPLASTFVLACMTLVCYYCWIVSAATRHALGWWIWYRSQYEVRLEVLDVGE